MDLVNTSSLYRRITTATTTVIDTDNGGKVLDGLVFPASPTGAVSVYDADDASGTPILVVPIDAPAGPWPLGIFLGTGLTIKTDAADEVLVVYRNIKQVA